MNDAEFRNAVRYFANIHDVDDQEAARIMLDCSIAVLVRDALNAFDPYGGERAKAGLREKLNLNFRERFGTEDPSIEQVPAALADIQRWSGILRDGRLPSCFAGFETPDYSLAG